MRRHGGRQESRRAQSPHQVRGRACVPAHFCRRPCAQRDKVPRVPRRSDSNIFPVVRLYSYGRGLVVRARVRRMLRARAARSARLCTRRCISPVAVLAGALWAASGPGVETLAIY